MFAAPSVANSVKNSNFSVFERLVPNQQDDSSVIKLGGYSAQYFPVRPLLRAGETDGAWLVAHKAEERRRFNELLSKQHRVGKRHLAAAESSSGRGASSTAGTRADGEEQTCLDGFYLLRVVRVDDPSFVCHVDVSGRNLTEVKEEDLQLFDSVTSLKAGENLLSLEPLNSFPNLRELEIPFNGLRNLKLTPDSFPNLEFLDVSYNELTKEDLFNIGLLKRLRRLHAGGNGLAELPEDLALPEIAADGEVHHRFQSLECLMLDDNRLSDPKAFASLACLRKLKVLSLEKNLFTGIPYLRVTEDADGISVTLSPTSASTREQSRQQQRANRSARGSRHSGRSSARKQGKQQQKQQQQADETADLTVVGGSKPAYQRSPERSLATEMQKSSKAEEDKQTKNEKESFGKPTESETPAAVVVPSASSDEVNGAADEALDAAQGAKTDSLNETQQPPEAEEAVNKSEIAAEQPEEPETQLSNKDEKPAEPLAEVGNAQPKESQQPADPRNPSASTNELNRNIEQLNVQMMRLNRPASAPLVEVAPFDLREIERAIGRRFVDQRQARNGPAAAAAAPFPALRSINLGGNRVTREESLIACGVWPSLTDLLIHDNPLCRTRAGELPLLHRLLTHRLGIRVARHRPEQGPKPRIEVEQRPNRRVVTRVPPVPKVNVDRLLLSIAAASDRPSMQPQAEQQPEVVDAPHVDEDDKASDWGDGVFLTTVTDQAAEAAAAAAVADNGDTKAEDQDKFEDDIDLLLSDRFGGVEDDDDDETLPQDVAGSVKALQYLLDHPITLDSRRPPLAEAGAAYREHRASRPAPAPEQRPTRAELARQAVETSRRANPRVELPLPSLLRPLPPLRERRRRIEPPPAGLAPRHVRGLLGSVERRYQAVRDRSLQQAKDQAKEKIAAMVEDIRDSVHRSLKARQADDSSVRESATGDELPTEQSAAAAY